MSKISALDQMFQNNVSVYEDMLPIVDVSNNVTKKIAVHELQGFARPSNPNTDITNLCESDYNIVNVTARQIGPRLAYIEAMIANGEPGIPATAPTAENLLTLPSNYFVKILEMFEVQTTTGTTYANSWRYPALIPFRGQVVTKDGETLSIRVQRAQLTTSLTYVWNDLSTWIAAPTKYSNGNVKGLALRFFVVMKPNVVLPYTS